MTQGKRFMPAEAVSGVAAFELPEIEGPILGHEGLSPEESRAQTSREIAALRREAWTEAFRKGLKEGHAEGYATGHASGLAQGQQEVEDITTRLQAIVQQLVEPLADVDDGVVEAVSELALRIARQLVGHELRAAPEEVVAVVREALQHLPVSPRVARIRLHPEDVLLVEAGLPPAEGERAWRLVPDPALQRGDCVVETDVSRIDATVEARLAAIAAHLLDGTKDTPHG